MPEPRALQKNAADRDQRKYAARVERRREVQRRERYRAVMQTCEGRFVLWDLVLRSGVFLRSSVVGMDLPQFVGQRDWGLDLMAQLQVSAPDLYPLLEQEWFAQQRRDDAETEAMHAQPSVPAEDGLPQ